MIQAIFFDFYNTLGKFYPPRYELQSSACANFGINVTKKGIDNGYGLADAFMASVKAHGALIDLTETEREDFFAEYESLILKGAGAKVSKDIAYQIWQRIQNMEYGIILFDDVLPTLDLLNQQGLTLGLISNIDGDIRKLIYDLKLSLYIDFAVVSSEIGHEKPHPDIFLSALNKAQVQPSEAIHVGDQIEADVEGAKAVGINPVLIDRYSTNQHYNDHPRIKSLMDIYEILPNYIDNVFK